MFDVLIGIRIIDGGWGMREVAVLMGDEGGGGIDGQLSNVVSFSTPFCALYVKPYIFTLLVS